MAGPITWRNVGSTVPAPSVASLAAGTAGIRQALADIGGLITQQRDLAVDNAKAVRDTNTQNYLDQVASASLEQLQNPEFIAGLDAQRDALGNTVDRAKTRGAIDAALATRQNQQVANNEFADAAQARNERGAVDSLLGRAAAGDMAGVEADLSQNQYMNEGKLRSELYAILDAGQQRQYRAAGEARAQAAADRAIESHALSMNAGRESLENLRETRALATKERNDMRNGEAEVLRIFQDNQEKKSTQNSVLKGYAGEMGLPTTDDGLPDMSKMDQEQKDALANRVRENGDLFTPVSSTAARQELLASLGDASTAVKKNALAAYDMQETMANLSPADQAKAQLEVGAATAQIDQQIKRRTERYETEEARNPYLRPDKDPLGSVNKILDKAVKQDWGTASNRQELSNKLIEWATNGITVKGENGTDDRTQVVPTAILEQAFSTQDRWHDLLDDPARFEKRVTDLLSEKSQKEAAAKAAELRESFDKDLRKLNNQKLSTAVKVTRSFQDRNGVIVNNSDMLNQLLEGR